MKHLAFIAAALVLLIVTVPVMASLSVGQGGNGFVYRNTGDVKAALQNGRLSPTGMVQPGQDVSELPTGMIPLPDFVELRQAGKNLSTNANLFACTDVSECVETRSYCGDRLAVNKKYVAEINAQMQMARAQGGSMQCPQHDPSFQAMLDRFVLSCNQGRCAMLPPHTPVK